MMSRGFLSKFSPVIILLVFFLALFSKDSLNAKSIFDWSWAAGDANVSFVQDVADTSGASYCPTYYVERETNGYSQKLKMCISNSGTIEFGKYYDGYSYLTFIKLPNDTKMRRLGLNCTQKDSCIYLSDSDTFVEKRFTINTIVQDLSVYKNFSKRVKFVSSLDPRYSYYSFDDSSPDYVYSDGSGYPWSVGALSVSNNGKWLAVEIREKGVGIFDPVTLTMRKVVDDLYPYGMGHNPSMELAVSNEGDVVALAGFNVNFSMYYVPPSCGIITITPSIITSDYGKSCRRIRTPIYGLFDSFMLGVHPWFNDQGSELSFFGVSYTGQQKEITLRANDYEPEEVDYLAMGDSFSSGEGETSDKFYKDGTNTDSEKCHLSSRSYPYVLSNLLGLNSLYVKSVACSGATTDDIIGQNSNYWGQGNRLVVGSKEQSEQNKTISQSSAREHFIPGRVTQESFVGAYQPKFLTVGIGGNDVGFMEKLKTCLGTDTCEWAEPGSERYRTSREISSLYDKLVDTYTKLHVNSPKTIIYAVGYPKVISTSGDCGIAYNTLLDFKERKFMDQGIVYMNQVIKAAASRAGVGYLDISDSLGDSVLCGSGKDSAMNAIRFGDDIAPLESFNIPIRIIGNESFHPNPLGHNLIAQSIYKYLGIFNIYYNQGCTIGYVVCPDYNIRVPNPGDYWSEGYDIDSDKISQITSNYSTGLSPDGRSRIILLNDSQLMPDSDVRIELHSSTAVVGLYSADELGNLNLSVDVPDSIPDGYHTLHVYGTSPGGDSLDLYQVVFIGQPYAAGDDKSNVEAPNSEESYNSEVRNVQDRNEVSARISLAPVANKGEVLGDSNTSDKLGFVKKADNMLDGDRHTETELANIYSAIGLIVLACLVIIYQRRHTKRP